MKNNLIIKGAKIFDGISSEPRFADIAVAEGKIDKIGENLSQEAAVRSIDASGLWLFPGLMDIHTHEDLEAELDEATQAHGFGKLSTGEMLSATSVQKFFR